MLREIRSGGQTGVDMAAFDIAIEFSIPFTGWVQSDRRNEDGEIPARYGALKLATSSEPAERTELNIDDSEGTLVIFHEKTDPGTKFTLKKARERGRPVLPIDVARLDNNAACLKIVAWLAEHGIEVLNVAGPRASSSAKIYDKAANLLRMLFARYAIHRADDRLDFISSQLVEANSYIRHWDTIRWIVPFGYSGVAAAGYAAIFSSSKQISLGAAIFSLFVTALGICALRLLATTRRYHNAADTHISTLLYRVSEPAYRYLTFRMPFDLANNGLPRTATFWFTLLLTAIVVFSSVSGSATLVCTFSGEPALDRLCDYLSLATGGTLQHATR